VERLTVNAAIVSITMDEKNIEGLVGTEAGSIYYINFGPEKMNIRLVSSNNPN